MIKIDSAKATVLVAITDLVVIVAFFSSVVAGVGTIGEEWRIIAVLGGNPASNMQWVNDVLIFGIVPVGAGLVFCIIDYALLGSPSRRLTRVSLLFAGVFFVIWGIYYSWTTYSSYITAAGLADIQGVKGIDGSLRIIYTSFEMVGILWLTLGIFLSIASVHENHIGRRLIEPLIESAPKREKRPGASLCKVHGRPQLTCPFVPLDRTA